MWWRALGKILIYLPSSIALIASCSYMSSFCRFLVTISIMERFDLEGLRCCLNVFKVMIESSSVVALPAPWTSPSATTTRLCFIYLFFYAEFVVLLRFEISLTCWSEALLMLGLRRTLEVSEWACFRNMGWLCYDVGVISLLILGTFLARLLPWSVILGRRRRSWDVRVFVVMQRLLELNEGSSFVIEALAWLRVSMEPIYSA